MLVPFYNNYKTGVYELIREITPTALLFQVVGILKVTLMRIVIIKSHLRRM